VSEQPKQRKIVPVNLGILTDVVRQLRLAWRLLIDERVPLWAKTIVPATLIYLISPIDFVPDVALGLGQLDDLAALVVGLKLFVDLCPPNLVREHMQNLLGESEWQVEPNQPESRPPQVIDAPYEIKPDEPDVKRDP
jgi:uncharacterized membrane protein YkvA (DUF1232 family)